MKLEVTTDNFDNFSKDDTKFCIDKEGKYYEVWESERTFAAGCMLGKMRVVLKDGVIDKWIMPLCPAPDPYELIEVGNISKWRSIIKIHDENHK
jgi:hypothetical protein